jgi:hypothetical protein
MHRDRERLDEAARSRVDPARQGHDAARLDQDLLGHAAVLADAVHHRDAVDADLIVPGLAIATASAGRDRLDRDRGPVRELAGDLVAGRPGDGKAAVEDREIGAADPAAPNADEDPRSARCGPLAHDHALPVEPNCEHAAFLPSRPRVAP